MKCNEKKQKKINKDEKVVEARFWSKFVGKPIFVKFGNKETILPEWDEYNNATSAYLEKRGFSEALVEEPYSLSNIAGFAFILKTADFEDFTS